MLAAILGQLATNKVQGLNAIRTLIDHRNTGIAGELGHAGFFNISVTAVNLLGRSRVFKSLVGQETFHHWGEQGNQTIGVGIIVLVRAVDQIRTPKGQRTRTFHKRFLIHQITANIRMHDQRISRALWVFSAGDGAALQAVIRISDCVLIRDLCLGVTLQAHTQTGFVHHNKHRTHAFVHLADHIALGAVIIHDASCIAVDAHFLFDLANRYAVVITQGPIVVYDDFRDDEQGHALNAIGTAGYAGQYKVNDVIRHIVVTRRDENLLASDFIRSVVLRNRLSAHQPQIGAAMRFCQVHRAGPFACDHFGQEFLLLRVRPMHMDRGIRAVGKALIHLERHIGRHH